jgi:hypothetical protein
MPELTPRNDEGAAQTVVPPDAPPAPPPVLDRSRPFGAVCGMPNIAFQQDGQWFRRDGTLADGGANV